MKTFYIFIGCFVHFLTGQLSAADVTLRITGSSSFRVATSNAIKNVMTFSPGQGIAYDNGSASFSGATWQTFVGSISGISGVVTIKSNWSGSEAGIRDTSQANSIKFLADGISFSPGGNAVAPPTADEGVPDLVLADNVQASTIFKSPILDQHPKVGIVPFAFVASKDTPLAITNLTKQGFRALLTSGVQSGSLLTGNPADTQPIHLFGRDPFSGARLNALAETKYGILNVVTQFKVISFTSGNTVESIDIYPENLLTVPDAGNDGESSGGSLAKSLRYTTTNVSDLFNGYIGSTSFLTYLAATDSYTAVFGLENTLTGSDQGNGRYLQYNGVSAFGGTAKLPASVNTTLDSPVLTGLPVGTANGLIAGQIVTGGNIVPGSVIASVDTSANTITLNQNATASGTVTEVQIGALLPGPIRSGIYTFWNYEYLLWKSSVIGTSGDKFTVTMALKNRITNFDYGYSGLADDVAMRVQRDGVGTFVYPK